MHPCYLFSGGVIAGVVGGNITKYCIFGDTVQTAGKLMASSLRKKNTGKIFLCDLFLRLCFPITRFNYCFLQQAKFRSVRRPSSSWTSWEVLPRKREASSTLLWVVSTYIYLSIRWLVHEEHGSAATRNRSYSNMCTLSYPQHSAGRHCLS